MADKKNTAKKGGSGKIIAFILALVLISGTFYTVYYLLNRGKRVVNNHSETPTTTQATELTTGHTVKETIMPKLETDDKSDGYLDGAVYIWQNKGYEVFKGTVNDAHTYADSINNYKKLLGKNYKVYNMVIPSATEISLPERLSKKISNLQMENINAIILRLSPDVTPVDTYETLGQHRNDETPLYYNTDKLWTQYGAYYAYTALTKVLDVKPIQIDTLISSTADYNFLGSHVKATVSKETKNGNPMLISNPDTVIYYNLPDTAIVTALIQGEEIPVAMPYYNSELTDGLAPSDIYATKDCAYTVIQNNAVQSGKIAVVTDKYGYALAPFLCRNYSEVHLIDIDNFARNLRTYLEENKITNVLYLNGIMSANSVSKTSEMDAMFQ